MARTARFFLVVALALAPFVRAGEPAELDAACRAIAKKLATSTKLTELAMKPFQQAPDEVRIRFFRMYDAVRLSDDNRAYFVAVVLKKDESDDVRLAAIGWLGKLGGSKLATKTLAELLGDAKIPIRAAAIQAIGGHKDPTLGVRLVKLLGDENSDIRKAAILGLGRFGDRKQVPVLLAAYKKQTTGDEADVPFGEALAMLGETDVSLRIAPLGMKSRDHATRLSALRTLECNPSMKVIPVLMENLILELRRTISLDATKPDWDAIYATMCGELQRRTGKGIGHDAIGWYDWWDGVRAQYDAPAPAFDRERVGKWLDDYQKMGPSKIRE